MGTLGFVPVLAILSLWNVFQIPYSNSESPADRVPLNLRTEGQVLNLKGRIFNDYALSGFLMLNFPELKVFIDGRGHTLFPVQHVKRYNDFGFGPSKEWAVKNFREMQVDYIAGNFLPENNFERHALSSDYKVQWLSHNFVLLSNKSPSFMSLSKTLFNPNCAEKLSLSELELDITQAEKLFGPQSEIAQTLNALKEMRSVPQDKNALDEFAKLHEDLFSKSDFLKRVLAFMYQRRDSTQDSVALLLSLNSPLPMDTVYLLEMAKELKDGQLAFSVIENALPGEWFYPDELQVITDSMSAIKSGEFSQPNKIASYDKWLKRSPAGSTPRQKCL